MRLLPLILLPLILTGCGQATAGPDLTVPQSVVSQTITVPTTTSITVGQTATIGVTVANTQSVPITFAVRITDNGKVTTLPSHALDAGKELSGPVQFTATAADVGGHHMVVTLVYGDGSVGRSASFDIEVLPAPVGG